MMKRSGAIARARADGSKSIYPQITQINTDYEAWAWTVARSLASS